MGISNVSEEEFANMTVEDKITTLKLKHASLKKAVDDEENRPMPNEAILQTLKREKLAIKDEIARIGSS